MGSASVRPSKRLADLLRRRRRDLGLTLRDVGAHTAERGDRLPESTLARIEQGRLEPGVRRLQMLADLYDIPPGEIDQRVSLDTLGVAPPRLKDPARLYERALELHARGEWTDALNHLLAVRQLAEERGDDLLRQKASLTSATVARNLGRFRLSKQMIDELLCEPPDPSLEVKCLVLASSLWRHFGSLAMADASLQYARGLLRPGQPELFAQVLHQHAIVAFERGMYQPAQDSIDDAVRHYRQIDDWFGEARARMVQARALRGAGRADRALRVARQALKTTIEHGHPPLEALFHVVIGGILVDRGQDEAAINELRLGLGTAVAAGDPQTRFQAHYELWKLHAARDESEQAESHLAAAAELARDIRVTAEVREVLGAAGADASGRRGPSRR